MASTPTPLRRSRNASCVRGIPLGRAGENDDIAGAAQFLASDAASWVSGAVIDVNGGSSYTL